MCTSVSGRSTPCWPGAVSTYRLKGVLQDLGKALGLPRDELSLLSGQLQSQDASSLAIEMGELPAFRERVDGPGWRDLVDLAPQLIGAPKGLGQHVGGMILSSSPIPEMVQVRAGGMEGRYIMDWNKDSVADAGFAKIDLLSLPVLDQLEEALDMIDAHEGQRPDLSRIDHRDPLVYDLINQGRAKGVFLLQSPAQLKMGAAAQLPQPAGPGLPGGADPPGRGGAGQRGVAVRGALPARRVVGLRPPTGGARAGAGPSASSSGRSRWCSW